MQESLASFLVQDYPDRQLIIVNTHVASTLAGDFPNVRIHNIKQPALPMAVKNWACSEAAGEVIIAWDEMSVYLPGFLTQIANAIKGREWCLLDKECALEGGITLRQSQGSEFTFAFTKNAWLKAGKYAPGIGGSSDRNLIGKITQMFPGENTMISPDHINIIRLGSKEERARAGVTAKQTPIKLEPIMTRDYAMLTECAKTGKRESRICVVELGRNGDIINILPFLKQINDNYATPSLMVNAEMAGLLDGISYVKPYVTQLHYAKLGQALAIAKQDFQIVVNAQVYGEGYTQKKTTPNYNMESWANCGFLHRFNEKDLRPVFDQRDVKREAELLKQIRGEDRRPMILVNVSKAISSPCPQCANLLLEIKSLWGIDHNVVNLADFTAHRIYDFLGAFERASCLVSIDTAWLHLAAATNIPVVALTNPKANNWAASAIRCGNGVASISYDDVLKDKCQKLHESIAAALERGNSGPVKIAPPKKKAERRVFHIVDRFEESDKRSLERKWKCQASWDSLYQSKALIPAHCWKYPRNAQDAIGDLRPLPYLKDLFLHGMNQCNDDDILLFTNDDNLIHPELPDYIKFHVSTWGPCSIFRTEFRNGVPSLEISPEHFGRHSQERHVGRDGFAFTKRWLLDNWDEIPDAILGASMWDVHLACLIRLHYGIRTTNSNIWEQILPSETPRGYTGHIAHQSAWLTNKNTAPSNILNGKLFLEWASKNLPDLKLLPTGELA